MNEEIFKIENQKYDLLWKTNYNSANWERLAKEGLNLFKSSDNNISLIDFGFGNGSAMDFFHKHGYYVEGVEISKYCVDRQIKKRKVYHSSLDDLHFLKKNQFNVGFCNDVIEHIPENLIVPSLNEMIRVCSDYLLISVCPTPSHHLSSEGENLHLTVKPKLWWEDLFRNYGKIKKINFTFSRSLRYIIDLNK